MMRCVMFLHKVVNDVDCTALLYDVDSRLPQSDSRIQLLLYPAVLLKTDHITRLQLVFN